jgi:GH15 family glucan-1,4-alpha-glucosidase
MTPEPLGASASFTLSEGEETRFVLAYGSKKPLRLASYRSEVKFEHTRSYWEELAASVRYEGMWRDEVVRSFLSLQLMIYEPTGAIVAAPTTSLPEGIGGSRTWDYRYAWLRDSSFTMDVLYRMGQTGKANRYLRWLLEHCKVTNGNARIVYGISMSSSLKEYTLDHLAGYRDSKPVRIGNGAESHLQLDVFGEVILGIESLYRNGGGITDDAWELVEHFADVACNNWHLKDRGVWETRGPQQHFVYSKVMCWVALDRAVALGEALGRTQSSHRWRSCADAIKAEVLERGWSDSKQAFVQSYDSEILDASALIIPFVGFLPCDHPMVSSTLDAIMRELADGPFVRRYNTQETDDGLDFQDEGAFKLLSFWLVGNLICTGRIEQATRYFEQLLGCANHVGLFAEMIDPRTGEFLGNFPQAYSHIGLIHTARNLSRALTGQPVKADNMMLPQMAFAD